jgi:hypothetical protein
LITCNFPPRLLLNYFTSMNFHFENMNSCITLRRS